jgi:hypothetical protein
MTGFKDMANIAVAKTYYTTLVSVASDFGNLVPQTARAAAFKKVRTSAKQKRWTIQRSLVEFLKSKYPKPAMELVNGVQTPQSKKALKKFAKRGRVCGYNTIFLEIHTRVMAYCCQIPSKPAKLMKFKKSHARAVHVAWMERGTMSRVMEVLGDAYFSMQIKVYWLVRHMYFTNQSERCGLSCLAPVTV